MCSCVHSHPIETLNNVATACVLVGKTMGTMFLIDDLITLNEYDEIQKQIDAISRQIDIIKKECSAKLSAMSAREKTKHIVAFGVESALTTKALNTILSACDKIGPLALDVLTSLNDATQKGEFSVAGVGNITVDFAKGNAATLASFVDGDTPKIAGGIAIANAVADEVKELTVVEISLQKLEQSAKLYPELEKNLDAVKTLHSRIVKISKRLKSKQPSCITDGWG